MTNYVRSLITECDVREGEVYRVHCWLDDGDCNIFDDVGDIYFMLDSEVEPIDDTTPVFKIKIVTIIETQSIAIGQSALHIEQTSAGIVLGLDHGTYTADDIRQLATVFNEMVEVLK